MSRGLENMSIFDIERRFNEINTAKQQQRALRQQNKTVQQNMKAERATKKSASSSAGEPRKLHPLAQKLYDESKF